MKEIIKIINEYPNPYPEDIFCWDSKTDMKITKGRFNEFIHQVVENTRQDIIRDLKENLTKHNSSSKKDCFRKDCPMHMKDDTCSGRFTTHEYCKYKKRSPS